MINNPELYIESFSDMSWEHYVQEMSKRGTWCDNSFVQGVCSALDCTIHLTDANPNSHDGTIILQPCI